MTCCGVSNRFPNKFHLEDVTLTFNFGPKLDEGELITLITDVLIEPLAGEDLDPDAMKNGIPSPDGPLVMVPIKGGIPGNAYTFTVIINTNQREGLVISGYISVY